MGQVKFCGIKLVMPAYIAAVFKLFLVTRSKKKMHSSI
jgi:hypothetical protein